MTSHTMSALRVEAYRALLPPPKMDFADWIERTIRLPGDVSAQTGPMRLTRVQRGIADAMDNPDIERVTVVKPVRLGYTSLLSALVGYYVTSDPSQILAVLPVESDCRGWVVDDLEPIFLASPDLRGRLSVENDPSSRSTLLNRRFSGGSLKIVAAKSQIGRAHV